MVKNNIRSELWRKGIKQADVVREIEDVNAVQFSAIVAGNVLPTKDSMKVICDMLECTPTDLYDRDELILTGDEPKVYPLHEADVHFSRKPEIVKEDHEGMERFRVWMRPDEKEALINACAVLGYRNTSEWFREMYREALNRCATIANTLSRQTENAAAAGDERCTVADIPHRLMSTPLAKV